MVASRHEVECKTYYGEVGDLEMDPLHLVGRAQAPLVEDEWKQLDEAVMKAADGGTDSTLLMETGAENADLCVAQALKTFYIQLKDMNHFFKCYEAVVPRIKRPTAIYEITGIT